DTITYTSFDKPSRIARSSTVDAQLRYDDERSLIYRADIDAGATITTYTPFPAYEEVVRSSGTQQLHYIGNGRRTVAVVTLAGTARTTRYLHHDQLGSTVAISDESGGVVERQSYDAFGKRRNGNWTPATARINSSQSKGYTGHVQLDHVAL